MKENQRQTPYTGWRSWIEKTQDKFSMALANGLGITVSSRIRVASFPAEERATG